MTDDDGWRRLHPLTPLLRGARFGLLLALLFGQQGLREEGPVVALAALVVAIPIAVALGYVAWRATRYRITSTELQVDSGVLTRRARRVPLARLQTVDVVRPLVARVFGLAELRLEVAGGGDTEAPLQYLSEDDAHALRAELLRRAGGADADDDAPEAPERVLVAVPTGPLVGATLLGAPVLALLLLLVVLGAAALIDARAAAGLLVAAVPGFLALAATTVRRLLTEYGFTVAEAGDGLRLRHGLIETRSATIPLDRVQLVRVRQPLLWRRFDWVRVEVDIAGYAGRDEQLSTNALLPVAPRPLALALVQRVLGTELPRATDPVPPRARWRVPVQIRALAVGLGPAHLVSTYGLLTRVTDVVPLRKVQSLRLAAGPWQRRLRLATLSVDTAARRLGSTPVLHRDGDEALGLLAELAARARTLRHDDAPRVRTPR